MSSRNNPVESPDISNRKGIFKEWLKRLCELDATVQEHLDSGYANGDNDHRFRFGPGDLVITLSSGVYYEGKIVLPFGARPFSDTARPLRQEDMTKPLVPTYIVHFDGWPKSADEEQLENALMSQSPDTVEDVHAMLYAHESNTYFRMERGLEDKQVGCSSWFLTDETYAQLEQIWQTKTETQMPFKEYSGRLKAEGTLELLQLNTVCGIQQLLELVQKAVRQQCA